MAIGHIYVYRSIGYTHHGIDCGDGTVIHYNTDGWGDKPSVRRTTLSEFAAGNKIHRRRGKLPAEAILRRAITRLGEKRYDPILNNCEHFATDCSSGQPESTQANTIVRVVAGICSLLLRKL